MKPVEITVTCANADEANAIMRAAVERRLAASGQIWPIRSCYRWNGSVIFDEEHVLLLKTIDVHFDPVCEVIRSLHGYDLPSVVMIPILKGGPGYMEWLIESTDLNLAVVTARG